MDASQSVDRWASLLDQQADTVLVVSQTGEILHATSSVGRLLGGPGDRLKGIALADLARPDERAEMFRLLAECLAHRGEPFAATLQFLDVERRWVSCDIQAVAPSAGGDLVVIWSLRDCSSRITRENRDAERAAHWRAMINAQAAGIILVDDDRIIREANPAARRILRLSAGPLGRDKLDRFFDPGDDVAAAWGTFIGDGNFQGRLRIRTAGNGERELEVMGRANVLPGRHLGVFRDITDSQVLERQLRRETNLVVASRIAGAIADEFDDILDSGIRNLDDLEARPAVIRASNLTRNLLAFSQRQILTTQAVDLLQAVLRLKPMIDRMAGSAITVVIHPSESSLMVNADPDQLDQVLLNLVNHACTSMPDGGRLTIDLSHSGALDEGVAVASGFARVRFHDTGDCLSEEARDSMFLPFGVEGNGGGLGLSVAWGIVQQLGGTLQVDPSDEEGNAIEIHIPRAPAREKPGPRKTSEAPPAGCVLLVEDEPAVLRLASRILRGRGYDVLSASSAAEALRLVDENDGGIDVLLTDVMMPGQSGTELARRLRASNPEIRILFMSGFSAPSVPAADILLEYPLLKKPFTPDMLGRFVHDALGPQEGR